LIFVDVWFLIVSMSGHIPATLFFILICEWIHFEFGFLGFALSVFCLTISYEIG